jgi:penicillin-binding protein 1C
MIRFVGPAQRAVDGVFGLVLSLILLGVAERAADARWPFPVERLSGGEESLRILAADGTVLRVGPTTAGERRIRIPLGRSGPHLVDALVAGEDKRFRVHAGVDPLAIVRAAASNLGRGRVVSGASTLTMQVVRLVEPRPRTLLSKLIEIFRARQLERSVTKDRILEAYLNLAPFGGTLRGAEAAALHWFGKHASDLTPAEAAMLVAMLPAPTRRAPDRRPDRLRGARNRVLERMLDVGSLEADPCRRAEHLPLGARRHGWPFLAPHHCDALASRAPDGGGTLRTSVDLALQRRVENVVRATDDAGVDGVAVVIVDRDSGNVRALIGSREYRRRPLDASRCRRAAGSTLKPFLFVVALESGVIGPDSLVEDRRTAFGDYEPVNFTRDHAGSMHAADALIASRNVPAVHLLEAVGVDRYRDLLRRAGLPARGRFGLDAALGTLCVSPLELARAYAALFRPGAVAGVSDRTRQQLLRALGRHSPAPEIVTPAVLAWKTGTSSGRRDAWCVGVTAESVVVVWLGNLDGRGAPDLVGGRSAAAVLAAVVAVR